ncbi:gamma-glutamyltransferase [Bryobacter aggregatus]|uniref:gamma-glutamyltransferase n=1 Tax=Bryobacter aggregatus TaxID=360054 RepID=UPI0004E18564|nr:gamma-glutamyltransferase [Bryobacter aggregatus]
MNLKILVSSLACSVLLAQEVSQSGLRLEAERAMVAQPERAQKAMVATTNEYATLAGLEILKKGGNSVDAAVAVAFALAVVHPEAGNLGGGGYLLVRMADGRAQMIDYGARAPMASKDGVFANAKEAATGYKSIAVPGTPDGMALAHKMYGKLPWKTVLEPARKLAKEGFPASQRIELILKLQVPVMKPYPESARVFLHGSDQPLKQGEILKQPALAETIARMQKLGGREFYEGETAKRMAADIQAHGGLITAADLKDYKAFAREPLETSYRGYPILTSSPSSSGGMAIIEMLNIIENFPMPLGMEGSAMHRMVQVEAMKRAFRDRLLFAGDPAYKEIPVARLTSKAYAKTLAEGISPTKATPSKALGDLPKELEGLVGESADTTHFSIVDTEGNMIANTYTLSGFYGSQVVAKGTGVLLGNIYGAFSGGGKHVLPPGERPPSTMTPTIVLNKQKQAWFALGSPGGATIPNTLIEVITNIIDFKMSLRDAIEFPRVHHQYLPDRVEAEPGAIAYEVAEKLKAQGEILSNRYRSQGDVHAVMIEEKSGWRQGWSDGRRGGKVMGY